MLKLLIVDDEVLVRKGIQSTIDWNSIGYKIIGDAGDGEKALEIARRERPDVVLTDIQMPKKNGLELIKALKEELPDTRTVVLSCHKDFEYVREAMQRWGAMDYILKLSMEPEDLAGVMEKVGEEIFREKMRKKEISELRWHMNENLNSMKRSLFNELLESCILDETTVRNRLKALKSDIEGEKFIVVCMWLDDYIRTVKSDKFGNPALLVFSVINVADEMIQNSGLSGSIFHRCKGEFGIVIGISDKEEINIQDRIRNLCGRINSVFDNFLGITASFGIGEPVCSLMELPEAYTEANDAVSLRFFKGSGSISSSREINSSECGNPYDNTMERNLRVCTESGKWEDAKNVVAGILDSLGKAGGLSSKYTAGILNDIFNTFSGALKQMNESIDRLGDGNGNSPKDILLQCETAEEAKKCLDGFVDRFSSYVESRKKKVYSREIKLVIEFIERNFAREIRLKDAAEYIHMNESYVSSLFKKETGRNFTDYINHIRMEKAKELLRNGDLNVYEVAELIGFESLSYFGKVFKQITGVTPAEYKKANKMGG